MFANNYPHPIGGTVKLKNPKGVFKEIKELIVTARARNFNRTDLVPSKKLPVFIDSYHVVGMYNNKKHFEWFMESEIEISV